MQFPQKQSKRKKLILMIFFLMIFFPSYSISQKKILLVGSQDTKASATGKLLELIYEEAFNRLGYEFEYRGYPNERANRMAETGIADGEIQRGASYENITKNLVRVKEPSFLVVIAAYATKPDLVLNGWESLKNTDYFVEYRHGSKVAGFYLPKMVKSENLSIGLRVEHSLKKLIRGRIDIFVEQEEVVLEQLKKSKYKSVYRVGIMDKVASYLYLNKKHNDLVPKISKILKEMKKEGLIEYYQELIKETK